MPPAPYEGTLVYELVFAYLLNTIVSLNSTAYSLICMFDLQVFRCYLNRPLIKGVLPVPASQRPASQRPHLLRKRRLTVTAPEAGSTPFSLKVFIKSLESSSACPPAHLSSATQWSSRYFSRQGNAI